MSTKLTIPAGYRQLNKGEKVLQSDLYLDYTDRNGIVVSTTSWGGGRSDLVYGQGLLNAPSLEYWVIVRRGTDGWILLRDTPNPYGKQVLFSNGKRIRVGTAAFSSDTHWQELPAQPLPPPPPDYDFVLNSDHTVRIKGDKSGVMVGCSKNSFVTTQRVKELAALL